MPQMAPLNWLSLFLFFTILFLMFNSMNYFSFMYTNKKFLTFKKTMKNFWKW
uniref:ATP synthase complex subunit 8 n=1 Tax=Staphylinoidea sp. 2 KM-2017 TaxID=2219456 RepID=A0A346RJP4_9COLE|nr:ATP synthase F0 subunit 8 [Staphylinoidea sp. 2 KM-2017]